MKRIAEPELMDSEDQVRAYAEADFEDSYSLFIRIFDDAFGIDNVSGYVLDLGCGPAEISIRFARTYPHTILHGVDGSEMMLKYGTDTIERTGMQSRVKLVRGMISRAPLPRLQYDAVVCNSLLPVRPSSSLDHYKAVHLPRGTGFDDGSDTPEDVCSSPWPRRKIYRKRTFNSQKGFPSLPDGRLPTRGSGLTVDGSSTTPL